MRSKLQTPKPHVPGLARQRINLVLRDLLVLLGGMAIVAGCWLASQPLGLIVGGLAAGAIGIVGQMDFERRQAEEARNRRLGI